MKVPHLPLSRRWEVCLGSITILGFLTVRSARRWKLSMPSTVFRFTTSLREPRVFPFYGSGFVHAQALQEEVHNMLAKGVLEVVDHPSLGFYSRLFLVHNATSGWFPVIDLSAFNTVSSVLWSIRLGNVVFSIDLKYAYFHIPIYPDSHPYLRFILSGTVYQFKALCFGLSSAPQVFIRVFNLVL